MKTTDLKARAERCNRSFEDNHFLPRTPDGSDYCSACSFLGFCMAASFTKSKKTNTPHKWGTPFGGSK